MHITNYLAFLRLGYHPRDDVRGHVLGKDSKVARQAGALVDQHQRPLLVKAHEALAVGQVLGLQLNRRNL